MNLDAIFKPKSVALIGASPEPNKIGHALLRGLLKSFPGKIYPINPKYKELMTLDCYKNISDVPGKVDLAVVAVPAPIVPDIMQDCGKKRS